MPRLVISSQFFLDSGPWRQLRAEVLPVLLSTRPCLRVWSAGCHVGKEPYSVAILLDEFGGHPGHRLLATDVDESLLDVARKGGPYSQQDVVTLSERQREKYLRPGGPPYWVVDRLQSAVTFLRGDVRTTDAGTDLDLVLFRDVEPFHAPDVNREVYSRLHSVLRPGGVLFVGATDAVPGWENIGYRRIGPSLFLR